MPRIPLFKASPDEPRDVLGRWTRAMRAKGIALHDSGGVTGLSRDQVMDKIKRILDSATGAGKGSRVARYLGAAAGVAASSVPGTPTDLVEPAMRHGAELADKLAAHTGHVVAKVIDHPAFRRLITRVILKKDMSIRKELAPDEVNDLKNIIAGVMADTRLDPHVSCSDGGLAAVACGAYRHLYDRICALREAAQ